MPRTGVRGPGGAAGARTEEEAGETVWCEALALHAAGLSSVPRYNAGYSSKIGRKKDKKAERAQEGASASIPWTK